MFSLAHTVRLVSVSFRSRAVAKRAMSYPFFLRVLICRRCHLWDEMSLGKDNNGREMMMRDAFGRVRLEGHVVARPKKKSGARRRIGEADPRGLESHRARPEVWASEGRYAQDCDDRAWFKIAISSRISRIASSRISIRAGASRTLWTTFERREDKKSLTRTFLFFFNANDRL